jgi:hypothetical protein
VVIVVEVGPRTIREKPFWVLRQEDKLHQLGLLLQGLLPTLIVFRAASRRAVLAALPPQAATLLRSWKTAERIRDSGRYPDKSARL